MKCPDENSLHMLLDGVLGNDEEAQLRAHLAECAACKNTFKELQKVDTLLKQAGDELPGDEYWATLAQRAADRPSSNSGRAYPSKVNPSRARKQAVSTAFWFLTHVAAVFIIVTTLVFYYTLKNARPYIQKMEISAQTELMNGQPSAFEQKIEALKKEHRKSVEIRSISTEM